jgi:DUF4097 and DUF4098 domain-containing protein YvlB
MKQSLVRFSLSALALCFVFAGTVAAQDFQKSYRVGAGGIVTLRNVSGDIAITGYDGDSVTVNGFKEGRDRDRVEVEDLSTGNHVDIRAKYPNNCNNCEASIRFEVRVPRSSRLNFDKISTASGNLKATGVSGELNLQTASGDVLVSDVDGTIKASTASGEMQIREVKGTVSASSASGNVDVQIARLEGAQDLKFSSASGNVNVKLPNNLDANVHLSTASGSISTDFPLEVKTSEHGPGSTARGQLGSGARSLRISSASGDVSLKSL